VDTVLAGVLEEHGLEAVAPLFQHLDVLLHLKEPTDVDYWLTDVPRARHKALPAVGRILSVPPAKDL